MKAFIGLLMWFFLCLGLFSSSVNLCLAGLNDDDDAVGVDDDELVDEVGDNDDDLDSGAEELRLSGVCMCWVIIIIICLCWCRNDCIFNCIMISRKFGVSWCCMIDSDVLSFRGWDLRRAMMCVSGDVWTRTELLSSHLTPVAMWTYFRCRPIAAQYSDRSLQHHWRLW